MIISFDVLGGAKYPETVAKIPRQYGIGIFWEEFGPAKKLVESEAKAGRRYIRVQGIWHKDHRYGSSADEVKSAQIAKELQALAVKYPGTLFELSPYCEHEKDASYMSAFLGKLKPQCPNVKLVNTPDGKGQFVSGFKNELHFGGNRPKPHGDYNASWDGLNCFDSDVQQFKDSYSDAGGLFYWCYQFNCHANGKDPSRDTKPTQDLINSAIYIATNQKQAVNLAVGWLYKSHSQQDKPVDPQGNKPVILQPALTPKASKIELWSGAKLVASFEYGGLTDDSDPKKRRHAWKYYRVYGYKLGGSLVLKKDGKLVGTVDAAFRQNEYRNKS